MPKLKNWAFEEVELTDEQTATAKRNGLAWGTVRTRVTYGWGIDEAVSLPPRAKREGYAADEKKPETKENRERMKDQAKKRADIAAFAAEIGISYGQAALLLDRGMGRKEIRKTYGKTYERAPHRWAEVRS